MLQLIFFSYPIDKFKSCKVIVHYFVFVPFAWHAWTWSRKVGPDLRYEHKQAEKLDLIPSSFKFKK